MNHHAWEAHLQARLEESRREILRQRERAAFQRRRAEMWKLRALDRTRFSRGGNSHGQPPARESA